MANAKIELNHFDFKTGKIQLEEVVMKNGVPSLYKVTFFGNTVSLNNLIGEDQLNNLSWLNNFNYTATNANVKTGLNTGINKTVDSVTYTNAIIYPLLAHSQNYIFNSNGDFDNYGNLSTVFTNHTIRGVFPEDLKPAIPIKIIIKAIEQQYNLTFKTGKFFNSAAMTNLYLWLHRDKGNLVAPNIKVVNNEVFTCYASSIICNHFSNSNLLPYFNKGSYLFKDNGSHVLQETFIYQTQVIPTDNTVLYSIEIFDEVSNVVVATVESVSGTNTLSVGYGHNTPNFIIPNTEYKLCTRINADVTLQFGLDINVTHTVFNPSANNGAGAFETYLANYISNSAIITTEKTIIINDQIPDIKVIDFLKGLFKMFNLTAYIDFYGQVVVDTLDNYFAGGQTQDITEYVKTNENKIGATTPFSEIDLQYTEAKSILAQQFFNTNNTRFGELQYVANASQAKKYTVTVPFEHMMFERLNDLNNNSQTEIQYGLFTNDNNEPEIGNPLIFYGVFQNSISPAINFVTSTRPTSGAPSAGTRSSLTSYWMPSNASSLGTASTAPTYNLNFGSEINSYTLTDYGGNNNSLFQLYYQNYITRIYNTRTRLFKFSAVLPLKVLLTLTLDDLIVIGTRAYTINKMSTKLQSGETSFELLNEPT